MNLKIFIYLLTVISFAGIVNASTIHGTVYDLSLKKVNNARVEIDTSPRQFVIAQNGTYSFNVPIGYYTIKSQLLYRDSVISSSQENITVKTDGSYVLDLILFPEIEEGVGNIDVDIDEKLIESGKDNSAIWIVIFLALIISLAISLSYYKRVKKDKGIGTSNKKAEESYEDNDLKNIMGIIKSEGGRTTQKEIRKQIPLSEAKISLMIAELEHKGIIEKIKKGRGNIIILKKKDV